jgi:MFS family permease
MWRGQNAAVFYIGYLFVGGSPLYRSMAAAAVRPLVRTSDMGLAYGLLEMGNALAAILAPLVAGFLYHLTVGFCVVGGCGGNYHHTLQPPVQNSQKIMLQSSIFLDDGAPIMDLWKIKTQTHERP